MTLSTAPHYVEGAEIRFDATVKDENGVLFDPTTISFVLVTPSGTISTKAWPADVEVVRDGVGLFHYLHTGSEHGLWCWRNETTGPDGAAQKDVYFEKSCSD